MEMKKERDDEKKGEGRRKIRKKTEGEGRRKLRKKEGMNGTQLGME